MSVEGKCCMQGAYKCVPSLTCPFFEFNHHLVLETTTKQPLRIAAAGSFGPWRLCANVCVFSS
jgi:hypothetical protein